MTTANTRTTRPLRFGVVAPFLTDLPTWSDQARRIADSGFSTLLMPDVPGWQPSPAPTLAVAATLTDLRVGTWVYASPARTAWHVAWEAHSMSRLTEGRFELGIGAGRPGIEADLATWGMLAVTPAQRWEIVRDAVATLREMDGPDHHTPVAIAVRGPKSRAIAAEFADTVTFPAMPGDTRDDFAKLTREFVAERDIELAAHVPVVGDAVSPFMSPPDTDTAALHAADSVLALPADPAAARDAILRRREEFGFSYVVVGANAVGTLAPVVAELAGT